MKQLAARIEENVSHRPWPLPDAPWIMFQSWRDLLFAHWALAPEEIRPLVPSGLTLDRFEGKAWVGLTPFLMTDLRTRSFPAVPGLSEFPEMNLRTYVRVNGKPGIFFFSLDAASRLGVWGARTLYHLPYHHARMEMDREKDWIRYRSRRPDGSAVFRGRYRPVGRAFQPEPGSLEHFLTERYALYVELDSGKIVRGDIHHHPWTVQGAEADIERNTVASTEGVPLPDGPPLLHFARRQDTLVWAPKTVS